VEPQDGWWEVVPEEVISANLSLQKAPGKHLGAFLCGWDDIILAHSGRYIGTL
jgi:hypothetical protein